jgi:hypothetical protein
VRAEVPLRRARLLLRRLEVLRLERRPSREVRLLRLGELLRCFAYSRDEMSLNDLMIEID